MAQRATRGESLRAYSERMSLTYLLDEWMADRNLPLTPESVSCSSRQKLWWRCKKGHEWQSTPAVRCSGTRCPYCSGKRPVVGENDLKTLYPELAAEWHPTYNNMLRPEDVSPGSDRKVWWRCAKGHEWQATVFNRSNGAACPVCSGRKLIPGVNDFATLFPALAAEWSDKNGALRPSDFRPYSNKPVWWVCSRGHTWQTSIGARLSTMSGCPYCANKRVLPGFNDLKSREPKIAAQWHPTLNGDLTPEQVVSGSHRKVWWRCEEGHVWKAEVVSRTGPQRSGCPICAGNTSREWRERYERELAAVLPADGP